MSVTAQEKLSQALMLLRSIASAELPVGSLALLHIHHAETMIDTAIKMLQPQPPYGIKVPDEITADQAKEVAEFFTQMAGYLK